MKHQLNCQVIDLEGVANHNGSAFGFVGHTEQPTNQQYSNNIAIEWYKLDATRPVAGTCAQDAAELFLKHI